MTTRAVADAEAEVTGWLDQVFAPRAGAAAPRLIAGLEDALERLAAARAAEAASCGGS